MGRKKAHQDKELKYLIQTRVDRQKYEELQALLRQNPNNDMSRLVRDILCNRPVKVFTRDLTLADTMEELARLRTEIRAIGVNVNQMTRFFNSYAESRRKEFYARIAFREYEAIQPKIDRLLAIISKLAEKWLQK